MKTGKVERQIAVYEKAKRNGSFKRLPAVPSCCVSWAREESAAHAAGGYYLFVLERILALNRRAN